MKITWRNSGPRRRVSRADQAVLSVGVGNRTVRSIFLSFLLLLFVNIINNNTNSLTPLIYIYEIEQRHGCDPLSPVLCYTPKSCLVVEIKGARPHALDPRGGCRRTRRRGRKCHTT